MWLKINDAQKWIGLTKYKYFFCTSLSREWVSLFKNTGDFVIRAFCSDHVIDKFRCKKNGRVKKYPHTHIYIVGLPDAQKRYNKSVLLKHQWISGTILNVVSLFRGYDGARIQFDFCSGHVRTVRRDVTWWHYNVMWRIR